MENPEIRISPGFDIEERVQMARDNFKVHGYNCCQSVLLAYADVIGLEPQTAAVMASAFGGGMGRLREVCGSVTAMFMITGFISPAADPSIKTDRTANYALVQDVAAAFREKNGSIVCRELLGLKPKSAVESPEPSDRTPEYYRKRPCEDLIACSARIIGERLLTAAGRQE